MNKDNKDKTGMLYLVATPIGNLEDITLRALKILRNVDLIAAEDTRHTMKLLSHYNIKKPMTSYYRHNIMKKGDYLLKELLKGKNIALVSSAGTPGISDPGEELVRTAISNGVSVTMVPGAVAAIVGLVLSGFATNRFIFEGFLPMNKKARKDKILSFKNETRTVILYEAPHKLLTTLKDLYNCLGDRMIALARELTKVFEEINRCSLIKAIKQYEEEVPKGEFVLILQGMSESEISDREKKKWETINIKDHIELYIEQGLDKKDAMKRAAKDRGLAKRDIYNILNKTNVPNEQGF